VVVFLGIAQGEIGTIKRKGGAVMDTSDLPGQVPDQKKEPTSATIDLPDKVSEELQKELSKELPEEPSKELPDQVSAAAEQPAKGGNLLKAVKIQVTKFSRRILLVLSGALLAVVALALASTFEPPQKPALQETPKDAQRVQATESELNNNLPDSVAAMPGKYSDLQKTAKHAEKDPIQGAATVNGTDSGNQTAGAQNNTGLVQRLFTVKEQRQKDQESATKAPLSFGNGGGAMRDGASATTLAQNLPPPDPSGGMTKILEKMSAVQGPGEQEDQNQQGEKRSFNKEDRRGFPYLRTSLLTPISPYEVKAGTILPGVLITGINSDLPGQITAQARENVYDTVSGRYLLIPIGSRYIGEYDSKISYGQERILVVWTRVIMPNGNSISLENMPGIDLSGYAGVSGSINNHYGKLVTGVVLGSILGATAQVAVGGQGTAISPPSFGQLATAGAATNLNQAGQQITQKNLNLQPTIEVSPGMRINIFVTKDMILKPYAD